MGLDMYLTRRVHVANYPHDPDGQKIAAAVLAGLGVKNPAQYEGGSLNIELPAGYWRKANAIHAWFVANVQGGNDDCEEYGVAREQLAELRALCQRTLENTAVAAETLPTASGFFFGSTEYDDGYIQDLQDTVEIVDRALHPDNTVSTRDTFVYRSSW